MRLVVTVGLAAIAGCIPVDPGGCFEDSDCGGELCTDVKTCAAPAEAPPWRIVWTVGGAAVSMDEPEACAPFAELALQVRSDEDQATYRPIACELGRFQFRALPRAFDVAALAGYDARGERLVSLSARGDRDLAEIVLDLEIEDR